MGRINGSSNNPEGCTVGEGNMGRGLGHEGRGAEGARATQGGATISILCSAIMLITPNTT